MEIKLRNELIRRVDYAGYKIYLYIKGETKKAVEFYILDEKQRVSKETLWVPKIMIQCYNNPTDLYGFNKLLDEYENKVKFERAGYKVF